MSTSGSSGVTQVSGEVNTSLLANNCKGQRTTAAGTSRTDTYTVPAGKYWIVRSVHALRTVTQAIDMYFTISSVNYVFQNVASGLSLNASPLSIRLEAGDSVVIAFTAAASGDLNSYIVYEEVTL